MNLLQCLNKSRIRSMCQHGNLMEDVRNGTSKQSLAWMSVPLPFWCTVFSGKECQRFRRSWGGEPVALWGPSGCSRCPETALGKRWHESIWVTSCSWSGSRRRKRTWGRGGNDDFLIDNFRGCWDTPILFAKPRIRHMPANSFLYSISLGSSLTVKTWESIIKRWNLPKNGYIYNII